MRATSSSLVGFAAIVAMLLPSPAAASHRHYASPDGSGTACTKAKPCALEQAVESAPPLSELVIGPGRYEESDTIDATTVFVAQSDPGKPKPKLVTDAPVGLRVNGFGTLISGIDIVHTGSESAVEVVLGAVQFMQVESTAPTTCTLEIGYVLDSVCLNTAAGGAAVGVIAGTGEEHAGLATNVTAIATGAGGSALASRATDGGDAHLHATSVIARGEGLDVETTVDAPAGPHAMVTLGHSDWVSISPDQPNTEITPPGVPHSITEDPLFADPEQGDFRQLPGSPTINAGDTLVVATPLGYDYIEYDFEFSPRVQGKAVDIGADEATDPRHLLALRHQHLEATRRVEVGAVCKPADCKVRAKATLRLPGPDETLTDKASLKRGKRGKLRFKLPADALAALRAEPEAARLKVKARAEDPVGFVGREHERFQFDA